MSTRAALGRLPAVDARQLAIPALAAGFLVFGALVAQRPELAAALVGSVLVVLLAFALPVANLVGLVFLTTVVPFGIQNQYGLGGGAGSAGLLVSDAMLLAGLARTGYVLARDRTDRRTFWIVAVSVVLLGLVVLQFGHGILLGRGPSEVGGEFRVLLGLGGALLLAVPILRDPAQRQRFIGALPVLGLLLGLWGLIQWTVDLPFSEAGDAGVRQGILQTTSGRGQIQGGLYAFPVAVLLSAAALSSGQISSRAARLLVGAVLLLNVVALLLTYERTFWLVTLLGLAFIALRGTGSQRLRALFWGPMAIVAVLAAMSTLTPDTFGAARERLLSLGQYESDNSLRYRVAESRHVVEAIRESPIAGSGLAASVYWGRPWESVLPTEHSFAHNGYLWLAWKLGVPIAALLIGAMLAGLFIPAPRPPTPLLRALRTGSIASLLALMLASVTFPAFSARAITVAIGVLLALAVMEMPERAPRPRA